MLLWIAIGLGLMTSMTWAAARAVSEVMNDELASAKHSILPPR